MLVIDYSVRCRKEKVTDELKELVQRAIETTLEFEEIEDDCEVSVTFVGNAGIRRFNAEYRGIDRVTDVLSFPIAEDGDLEEAFDGEKDMLTIRGAGHAYAVNADPVKYWNKVWEFVDKYVED